MNNSVPPVLRRAFRLHSYEVDQKGRARADVLLSFMLDSAWAHANNSEFSYDALRKEGQLWVLSRFFSAFHAFPKWDDEINVETWSRGTDRLFGLRDFVIHSDSEEKLVSATSAWLVIDRKTSRIQRIDLLHSDFPVQKDKHELDVRLEKLELTETSRTDFEHIVRYSDIDVNNHVNSSQYVKWILDSFPRSVLEEKDIRSLEINFLSEAQVGDKVIVSTSNQGDYFYCESIRENDGVELCRAKVSW